MINSELKNANKIWSFRLCLFNQAPSGCCNLLNTSNSKTPKSSPRSTSLRKCTPKTRREMEISRTTMLAPISALRSLVSRALHPQTAVEYMACPDGIPNEDSCTPGTILSLIQ